MEIFRLSKYKLVHSRKRDNRIHRSFRRGKSTLLKSLNRMNDLVEGCKITGDFTLDGENIYKDMEITELRKRVGMVFQKPNLFPMSIYDNISHTAQELTA